MSLDANTLCYLPEDGTRASWWKWEPGQLDTGQEREAPQTRCSCQSSEHSMCARARSQTVFRTEIQMPKAKLSNTDGTVVCVTVVTRTCLTLLQCWKTQTTLEQQKSWVPKQSHQTATKYQTFPPMLCPHRHGGAGRMGVHPYWKTDMQHEICHTTACVEITIM